MYSHELQDSIQNGTMPKTVYLNECNVRKSPQILRMYYDASSDTFTVVTNDDYNMQFKIQ